jgi:hypothetical protein
MDDGPQCTKKGPNAWYYKNYDESVKHQKQCAKGEGNCKGLKGFVINGILFPEWTFLSGLTQAIFGPEQHPFAEMMAIVTGPRYTWNVSTGQYRDVATGKFVSPDDLPWPPKRGFATGPVDTTLPKGTILDRYGKLTGRYASEPGFSASERGMAPGSLDMPYTQLKVIKPVTVPAGSAAAVPEFGASGGAPQYFFDGGLQSWIDDGYLEILIP